MNIQSYMTRGVTKVVLNALRVTAKNKKEAAFSARSLRDLIAAAAQLFVKYCVIGVGNPPGLSDPYALSFAKISSVAVRSSFSPAIFCSNKLPGIGRS